MIVDTLRVSKQLQDKGLFSAGQADVLAETIGAVGTENLATKRDLSEHKSELKAEMAEIKSELKTEIAELKSELKVEIEKLKSELLKWIIGAIGFQTLVIIGAVVTLSRLTAR